MNCVVCLCVYNNEFGLPFVLKNILKINEVFSKIQILAFYDNSSDKSLDILHEFKETHGNMEIIINTNPKCELRTQNIANARNGLLEIIRKKYNDVPYFIMMDSNEYSCIGNINIHVLQKVLERSDEWDSLSFDREAGYYDTWALSFDPFIYSFFHFANWRPIVELMRTNFKELMDEYNKNKPNEFIPVYSAFNGFAIYKTSKFLDCSYSSTIDLKLFPKDILLNQIKMVNSNIINNLTNDCEHRHFHLEAIQKNNAKIKICQNFLFAKFINPPKNLRGPA
uniref:Glycosyltransferase 2-like domain-containing protein n=1 Tax=viral metagenome TaxID=1070528 RepID=A0A6C0HBZ7_9ZZZZ